MTETKLAENSKTLEQITENLREDQLMQNVENIWRKNIFIGTTNHW